MIDKKIASKHFNAFAFIHNRFFLMMMAVFFITITLLGCSRRLKLENDVIIPQDTPYRVGDVNFGACTQIEQSAVYGYTRYKVVKFEGYFFNARKNGLLPNNTPIECAEVVNFEQDSSRFFVRVRDTFSCLDDYCATYYVSFSDLFKAVRIYYFGQTKGAFLDGQSVENKAALCRKYKELCVPTKAGDGQHLYENAWIKRGPFVGDNYKHIAVNSLDDGWVPISLGYNGFSWIALNVKKIGEQK